LKYFCVCFKTNVNGAKDSSPKNVKCIQVQILKEGLFWDVVSKKCLFWHRIPQKLQFRRISLYLRNQKIIIEVKRVTVAYKQTRLYNPKLFTSILVWLLVSREPYSFNEFFGHLTTLPHSTIEKKVHMWKKRVTQQ